MNDYGWEKLRINLKVEKFYQELFLTNNHGDFFVFAFFSRTVSCVQILVEYSRKQIQASE